LYLPNDFEIWAKSIHDRFWPNEVSDQTVSSWQQRGRPLGVEWEAKE
jgi:hypothetical protein